MSYFETIEFIVKRAFRRGHCLRKDVRRAFELTESTATRRMSDALARHANVLVRRSLRIEPKPQAEPPAFASDVELLKDLDRGHAYPGTTGLFEEELPINRVRWLECAPPTPGSLSSLTRAIIEQRQVRITYLGVREREEPEFRQVLPLGLEQMADQWRLIALDVDISDCDPVRTFVLTRILKVDPAIKPRRVRVPPHGHNDALVTLRVHLSSKYSSMQREVLARELRVIDGKLRIPERATFEFLRRFSDQPVSPNAVWPPISHFERFPPATD